MKKTAFVVLVALAVLAAEACQSNLTGPDSRASAGTVSNGAATTLRSRTL
jgi:hypothetical protein